MDKIDKMDNLINTETRHKITAAEEAISREFRKTRDLVMRLAAYMKPEHIEDEFLPAANSIKKMEKLIRYNSEFLGGILFDNDDKLYLWEDAHDEYDFTANDLC